MSSLTPSKIGPPSLSFGSILWMAVAHCKVKRAIIFGHRMLPVGLFSQLDVSDRIAAFLDVSNFVRLHHRACRRA